MMCRVTLGSDGHHVAVVTDQGHLSHDVGWPRVFLLFAYETTQLLLVNDVVPLQTTLTPTSAEASHREFVVVVDHPLLAHSTAASSPSRSTRSAAST